MVVDDAVVVRSLLARWVDAEPDMQVVASLRTGREAVAQIEQSDADVVVLDIDMPELDGISALPLLLQKKRDLVVIMVSTLTRRSAEISLRALALGAADYIPKPETTREATTSASFRRELIEKIRTLGRSRSSPRAYARAPAPGPVPSPHGQAVAGAAQPKEPAACRPEPPRCVAAVRPDRAARAPDRLFDRRTAGARGLDREASRRDRPRAGPDHAAHAADLHDRAGRASVAHRRPWRPRSRARRAGACRRHLCGAGRPPHARRARTGDGIKIALGDDPPINFCKPAVDALFTSAASVWGAASLALVLTGMGADGTRGAADIVAAGGSVIAQDEATSVVWGMPRSVAQAGLCSAVLPLDQIAPKVIRLFSGERS